MPNNSIWANMGRPTGKAARFAGTKSVLPKIISTPKNWTRSIASLRFIWTLYLDALSGRFIWTLYLDFAELQAVNRKPMTMQNWLTKLDDFMRISDREILTHAGAISHEQAKLKAETEFEKYRVQQDALPSPVEKHFEEAIKKLPSLKPKRKK
jgi:hypothetical protein